MNSFFLQEYLEVIEKNVDDNSLLRNQLNLMRSSHDEQLLGFTLINILHSPVLADESFVFLKKLMCGIINADYKLEDLRLYGLLKDQFFDYNYLDDTCSKVYANNREWFTAMKSFCMNCRINFHTIEENIVRIFHGFEKKWTSIMFDYLWCQSYRDDK